MLRTRKVGYGDSTTREISLITFVSTTVRGLDGSLASQHEQAVVIPQEES